MVCWGHYLGSSITSGQVRLQAVFTSRVVPLVGLCDWARLHKSFWFCKVLGCASIPGGDVDWSCSGGDTGRASQSEEVIGCALLCFWARSLFGLSGHKGFPAAS